MLMMQKYFFGESRLGFGVAATTTAFWGETADFRPDSVIYIELSTGCSTLGTTKSHFPHFAPVASHRLQMATWHPLQIVKFFSVEQN